MKKDVEKMYLEDKNGLFLLQNPQKKAPKSWKKTK